MDRGAPALVLLALVIVVPMALAIWFVSDAIATQSEAARHGVLETYRAQLRLVRARVDAHWQGYAARLNRTAGSGVRFAQLVGDGLVDGAVLLDASGRVVYPDVADRPGAGAGRVERPIALVERLPTGRERAAHIEQAAALLNDYSVPLAASERLALMTRLRQAAPNVVLPTESALRVSMALRGAGRPSPAPGHFQQTAVRDVWALSSADEQVVALYWTGRIESMMHDLLHEVAPAGIRFIAFPPDIAGDPEAIAAGMSLPGWQLTFQPLDRATLDAAARRQALAAAAVGGGGIAVMALLGLAAARTFTRHLRLARLKTDLVAAVSHELRTPLASMRVLVDGLLADRELDPAKTRDYLQLIASENTRLTRLIENFLTFSRLERGRQQFVFSAAHPASIVAAAAETMRDRLAAGCDFRVDVDPDLSPIVADADALVTAVVNLLDNALKYTAADKRIVLRARRDGSAAVLFAVGDNGIGIPAREQRRIFRRFYRVDRRLTRDTSGVGLGLSIVELIVRAHGGTVAVESEPGAGSTFTLRLPCAREGVAA